MDLSQVQFYFNIGLIVLFVLIALGLLFAALRGLRRGIWKSTHNMIFMFSLLFIAFFTLNAITDIVGSFQISTFVNGSLYITREFEDGTIMTYWVPITTVKETLTEYIKGFYTLFNVSASASSATNFAIALVGSVLKVAIFIVEMILIVTLGNLLSFITWFLIFRHFIPRIARKVVKLRWVGMAETMVTFLVVTVLFMTPFTSLVNSLNQSYQRHKTETDNQLVTDIGNFVDAYNDSLFAKILFNWSVDSNGMTYDTRLFDKLTTSVSGEYSIGLVGELANITNVIVTASYGVTSTDDSSITYDPTMLITKEVADMAFDVVINSGLVTGVLPVAIEIALNSDILEGYVPNRLVDLSDVDWAQELGYVKDMVDCVFDSGVVDNLFVVNEEGRKEMRSFEGNDMFQFIESIVYSENFNRLLDIFKSIDNSKVLSRAVPAVMSYVMNSSEDNAMKQYLPLTWDEMNELSWGFESYVLLDFLHSTVALDDDFLKAIFIKSGIYEPEEGEEVKALQTLIAEHIDEFKSLVVGKFDSTGNLINVDKHGQTIVFKNGQRIKDGDKERNYCLFDMNLVERVLPTLLDGLFDLDALADIRSNLQDEDIAPYKQAVADLNNGVRLVNYKKEFDSVLDIVAEVGKDEELVDALMSGEGLNPLMKEEGDFFSIEKTHIQTLQRAIKQVDDSSLLYGALTPMLKSYLIGDDLSNALNDFGLRADVIISHLDHDVKKENHRLFNELSDLFDNWDDIGVLNSLMNAGDDLMSELKDQEKIDSLVHILNAIHDSPIINPSPEAGDDFEENENLYGLLEYIFGMASELNLNVTRDTLRGVETPTHSWNDEFTKIGEILHFIAVRDITNASSTLDGGLTRTNINKLRGDGEGDYYISGLFPLVDQSHIFSETLGPFLDDMFGDSLGDFLINKEDGITFSNVTDWTQEGTNIDNLLASLYNITPEDDEEAKDFLSNLDVKTINKLVDLNEMLHNLAHSGIFTYIDAGGTQHFQFGKWLYDKINSSMGEFSVDENKYDLLADPKFGDDSTMTWETTWAKWGTRPEDIDTHPDETVDQYFLEWKEKYNTLIADGGTVEELAKDNHYISYRDFVYINGYDNTDDALPTFWCNYDVFVERNNAFKAAHESDLTNTATYLNNDWEEYFGSDAFVEDYGVGHDDGHGNLVGGAHIFEIDEISRVVHFMCYAMRILEERPRVVDTSNNPTKIPFNEIPTNLLDNMLTTLNETYCMRVGIYNFYRIAAENVFNNYSSFDLKTAYNAYMVDADTGMFDYTNGRPARQAELDKLTDFYGVINDAKEKGIIENNNFKYEKMNDDAFMSDMERAMKGLNDSYVYHRKGSAITTNNMTTFQSLFNSMLGESETKKIIYPVDGTDAPLSPKDKAADPSTYTDGTSKIRYLVTNIFLKDSEIDPDPTAFAAQRNLQQTEVHNLINSVKYMYSLVGSDGVTTVTNIKDADMSKDQNRETISDLLHLLNSSELLYDLVPNTMYNMFIKDKQFSIKNGEDSVSFDQVDPYYHYYYDDTAKRSSPDFTAKYLPEDLAGIDELLLDYQNFKNTPGSDTLSNPETLMSLTGHMEGDVFKSEGSLASLLRDMHDCNLFHTPARHGDWALYYTDAFNGNANTQFEEVMSKVCHFVKLDDFAYDTSYQPDVDNYGSADAKLKANIKALTTADDGGIATTYYHNGNGTAWDQEIHTIMKLAYDAAKISHEKGQTSLNISSFELDKLSPAQVKDMLTDLNACDLAADALPKFIKDGFTAIKLGTLTSYSDVDYATYRLSQAVYGGTNALAEAGTEIDNIYNVMTSLYTGTGYVEGMDNLTNFVKTSEGQDGLRGLIQYLYCSHVLNTNKNMDNGYNQMYVVDGKDISARGALIVNSLGNDLAQYIARDANASTALPTKLDQISRMSHLLALDQYKNDEVKTYTVEAEGLITLVSTSDGKINAETLAASKIQTEEFRTVTKPAILTIIGSSYNATNEPDEVNYKRSVISSEFISGVLNNLLENEYTKMDNPTNYPGYQYILFSFGNDVDDGVIQVNDYQTLNQDECDGLDGMIDSFEQVNNLNTLLGNSEKIDALKANFAKMGPEPGKNSKVAQAIYLAEAHAKFKVFAAVPNARMEYFPVVDETTVDPNEYDVYGNSFCFKNYGQAVEAFLS